MFLHVAVSILSQMGRTTASEPFGVNLRASAGEQPGGCVPACRVKASLVGML